MSGEFKYLFLVGHKTKYLENGFYSAPSSVYISYPYKPFSKYNLIRCLLIRNDKFYLKKLVFLHRKPPITPAYKQNAHKWCLKLTNRIACFDLKCKNKNPYVTFSSGLSYYTANNS